MSTPVCDVRDKYVSLYNESALQIQDKLLGSDIDITIKRIDHDVINDWSCQWQDGKLRTKPNGGWDWRLISDKYKKNCKRLDIAIYSGDKLECLAIGQISKGRYTVRLDYIEGSPYQSLKGYLIPITTMYAAMIGKRLDSKHVAIFNPINETVANVYKKYGFEQIPIYAGFEAKTAMYKSI
jgi:hypothetical protein